MPGRSHLQTTFQVALLLLGGIFSPECSLFGGDVGCGCRTGACACVRRFESNGWKVLETGSFRIHHIGHSATAERLTTLCEQQRQSLRQRWLDDRTATAWSPKCDLFLYRSPHEFQRLTRRPAAMWGYADLEIGQGRVWMRQLHVRADDPQRLDKLLVHELTHVVLADYFANHQIPRWADEGIAALSEPPGRQAELRRFLKQEVALGRVFSLHQLMNQKQIPGDQRLGDLFYAQSLALIDFLRTERKLTEPQVLRFVAECETRGLSATVSRWFPDVVATTWESEWRQWITATSPEVRVASDRVAPEGSGASAD